MAPQSELRFLVGLQVTASELHACILEAGAARLRNSLESRDIESVLAAAKQNFTWDQHGDLRGWFEAFCRLGPDHHDDVDLTAAAIRIGRPDLVATDRVQQLEAGLRCFTPWRKGPFEVFGIHIDSEWRSDMKWSRLSGAVDWTDKRVLDVGCGNGYYALRAIGAGAASALGVDPSFLFVMQFATLNGWIDAPACVLPLRFEDLPITAPFDVVMSLGVLGHRKNPAEHLTQLRRRLHDTGCLVLETLVAPGDGEGVLRPQGRYAAMRNVYELPTLATLRNWVLHSGFKAAEVIDVTVTGLDEQRATEWMPSQSLADFLDPQDRSRTREGYPAPTRAVLIALP